MGAKMTINDSFYKKVDTLKIENALKKAITQTAIDAQKALIKEAPGPGRSRTPNPTGNLRRSHSYEVRVGSGMIEALLKNSANYWQYVAFGTSKMAADDFVTRAFETVSVASKTAEYFHQYYGGGG